MTRRIFIRGNTAMIDGENVTWEDTFVTLTPPNSGNRADRVYVDADGNIGVENGPPFGADELPSPPGIDDQLHYLRDVYHLENVGPPNRGLGARR